MGQGPRLFALGDHLSQTAVNQAGIQTFVEAGFEIPGLIQLIVHPALLILGLVALEVKTANLAALFLELGKDFLGGEHAGFDGVVRALDFGNVEEACRAAG